MEERKVLLQLYLNAILDIAKNDEKLGIFLFDRDLVYFSLRNSNLSAIWMKTHHLYKTKSKIPSNLGFFPSRNFLPNKNAWILLWTKNTTKNSRCSPKERATCPIWPNNSPFLSKIIVSVQGPQTTSPIFLIAQVIF